MSKPAGRCRSTGKGGSAVAGQGDISKAADVKRLFEETGEAFDRLDALVNNAGIFKFEPIEAATEGEFRRVAGGVKSFEILNLQEEDRKPWRSSRIKLP